MTLPAVLPFVLGDDPRIRWLSPPKGVPAHKVITDDQIVSLHTLTGMNIFQFTPNDYETLVWGREQNNASAMELDLPPLQGIDRLPDIAPWLHWLTIWDGGDSSVMWSGPIQKVTSSRKGMILNAKDHGAYLARTRAPTSKQWDKTDPALIAAELWQQMIETQGLKVMPIAATDPYTGGSGNRYDFTAIKDDKMLDQMISDLVNLGMVWTVLSGVPIIGPINSRIPVASLSDVDFTGLDDIQLTRDGSLTYNDILVKIEGNNVQVGTDYYGQRLQLLKTLNHLSDVSDATAAARAYLRHYGDARTILTMPGGVILHPNAAVTLDQLVPSARFIIETQGLRQRMQLTSMDVTRQAGESSIKVTMISDEIPEELDTATDDKKASAKASSGSSASAR